MARVARNMIRKITEFLKLLFLLSVVAFSSNTFAQSCVKDEQIIRRSTSPLKDIKSLDYLSEVLKPGVPEILNSSTSMLHIRTPGDYTSKRRRPLSWNAFCADVKMLQRFERRISRKQKSHRVHRRVICSCNGIFHAYAAPNDLFFYRQWALDQSNDVDINLPEARGMVTGSSGVVIAIIDTDFDYNHPDLRDAIWTNPWEIPNNSIDDDLNGYVDDYLGFDVVNKTGLSSAVRHHGTHVAGIAAAIGNNEQGVIGSGAGVKFLPVRALNSDGSMTADQAVIAINYITALKKRGVNIVAFNASWGGLVDVAALQTAIAKAIQEGILSVVAAGNNARDISISPDYPASYSLTGNVAVAAVERDGSLASYSNFGAQRVALGAPGSDILSAFPNGGYNIISGTSMAAPLVTGLVGLHASRNNGFHNPSKFLFELRRSIKPLASLQGRTTWGGIPDAARLVNSSITANSLLTGIITASGQFQPNVGVYVWSSSLGTGTATVSDNFGRYTLYAEPGTYTVTPFKPGYSFNPTYSTVTLSANGSTSLNLTGQKIQGVSIYGRVTTAAGLGVPNARIDIRPQILGPPALVAFTRANGTYTSPPQVQFLDYRLTTTKPGIFMGYSFPLLRPTIAADNTRFDIVATANPTSLLSGRYTVREIPLRGVRLQLENAVSGFVFASAVTGTDGEYSIPNIVDGPYALHAEHELLSKITEAYRSVSVNGATTFNYNSPARYSISGTVRYPDFSCGGKASLSFVSNYGTSVYATDDCGKFSLTLAPGRYDITVTSSVGSKSLYVRQALINAPLANFDFVFSDTSVAPPYLTKQPAAAVVQEGGILSLTIVGSGTGLVYRWYLDEVLAGTSSTLEIPNVTRDMYGSKIEYLVANRAAVVKGGPLILWPVPYPATPPVTPSPTPTP